MSSNLFDIQKICFLLRKYDVNDDCWMEEGRKEGE
jgi:hypothetical protein